MPRDAPVTKATMRPAAATRTGTSRATASSEDPATVGAAPNLHLSRAGDGGLSIARTDLGGKQQATGRLALSRHARQRPDRLADQHGLPEDQILSQVERGTAGDAHSHELGEQRREEDAVHHAGTELGGCRVLGIDVQRAEVAGDGGERQHVLAREGAVDLERVADLDRFERAVVRRGRCLDHGGFRAVRNQSFASTPATTSGNESIASISLTSNETPNSSSSARTRLM